MQKDSVGELETHFGYVETDPTGRYGRFEEILGKGAMKTVYKAIDEVLGMEVAWSQIKLNNLVQSADNLQRLNSEVHLLSTLNHDSIVRFYTSWIDVDQRTFNFITEMFTSGTLREYRKKYKRLDICAIKIWARQILSGLVYLHCHNPPVIHRDIKCDNIFVNGHLGQVKIGDLGLAAVLPGSRRAHSVIGTPEFMAPELYEENYNELVDIYSFGMCVLEMLTSEYPYSECTNPAQIYKKVTSEKLPRAFYKIESLEAQSFISKCLAPVSKRLSAAELLLDPFLVSEGDKYLPMKPAIEVGHLKPFLNENLRIEELQLTDNSSRTKMTITGSLNAEDNTIFLKVKLSDEEGSSKNVYFPFDILNDTPLDVAIEMVKELEITDWEPFEIADMIDGEISLLVPNWKKGGRDCASHSRISKYDEENDRHHFHSYRSFSCSSCASLGGTVAPSQIGDRNDVCDWLCDDLFNDTSSQSSLRSGKYSNLNYCSIEEHYNNKGPREYEQQQLIANTQNYAEQNSTTRSSSKSGWVMDGRRLTRNRSLVDMRSQLLHRTLVEEINKRRLFKTAGALEDVGFQSPPLGRSHSQTNRSVVKGQKQKESRA